MDTVNSTNHPMAIAKPEEKKNPYHPSDREQQVVQDVFLKFSASANERNKNYKYLDDRNIIEYINDSVGRFITNLDERDGIEDWQARANVPLTHTKVGAVLGKIVSQLPIAEISHRVPSAVKRAKILNTLYQYAEDVDDYEELMVVAALEAIVKGTVVGYEGYTRNVRKKRDIVYSGSSETIKEAEVITTKLCGSIVPLEEFYPSSVGIRRIEDMPYAFRRYVIPYSRFVQDFSNYDRWDRVDSNAGTARALSEERPFYVDYVSTEVTDGNVEVIEYYNKDSDEHVIIANGLWLNPVAGEQICPNPFSHKRLPFWSAKFDILGADFFYGKSLVDRISSMQDILNVLTNMLLDQSFLTIFPPILTAGVDSIEEDYLRPGRRVPVDTQGLPLSQAFMKLDLGTPGGWHQFILEYTKSILEQSSVDQVTSGTAGVGGRTTAEEIRAAAAGVAAILGVFGILLNIGIKNKAALKAANILQFWTREDSPIDSLIGDTVFEGAFNIVTVENQTLQDGNIGDEIVAMYPGNTDLPSTKKLQTVSKLYEKETGRKANVTAITGDFIRNVQYIVKLVPNPKAPETLATERALVLEKAKTYMTLFPETTNKQKLAASVAVAFGDDPSDIFDANNTAPAQQTPAPNADVANNMMRGLRGGEQDDMAMRDIGV